MTYYRPLKQNIHETYSNVYIAKRLDSTIDEFENETTQFEEPKKYRFNVQPLSSESEIREFGELAPSMKSIIVRNKNKYLDEFKEFDRVYIEGVTPEDEIDFGDNANYRIYSIRNFNTAIRIYAIKLVQSN